MQKQFKRIISFEVEGEIYDNETKPEDILKNYEWNFKDYNDGKDKCFLVFEHKDSRGKITKMTKLSKINKAKKPDTEYFIV
jgi:hypothetical protein